MECLVLRKGALAMQLDELLDNYLACREASISYQMSMRRTVRKCQNFGLHEVSDLEPALVNRFLASLSTALSDTTRSNIRRELMTLWRFAFEAGETEVPAVRVRRIRPARKPVEAWCRETLALMLSIAEQDNMRCGGLSNPRICDWLPAWIVIGYDTGLRFSDIYELHSTALRGSLISLVARKTGKPLVRHLSNYAAQLAHVLKRNSPDGTLFRWMLTRRRIFIHWRKFLDRNGISGSSRWLRRSCATYIEASSPGMASRYLQHSQPNLVGMHYLDQSLLDVPEGPPSIRDRR